MIEMTPMQSHQISRSFDLDFTPPGAAEDQALAQARAQLAEARFVLETTVAAVMQSCPAAIDAAFASSVSNLVLKAYRLSR